MKRYINISLKNYSNIFVKSYKKQIIFFGYYNNNMAKLN